MKINVKNSRIISFIVIAMLMSTLSFAQGKGPRHDFDNIPGLTDDQKTKIEDLRTPHMKKMLEIRTEKDKIQAELRILEIADNPDQKKINAKIDELMAAEAKMFKERSAHKQAIRKILTPDQRVLFDSQCDGPKGPGQEGFGNGPQGPGQQGPGQQDGFGKGPNCKGPDGKCPKGKKGGNGFGKTPPEASEMPAEG